MPNYPPPDHCSGEPRESVLPTGLTVSRVHSSEFAATSFNPRLAESPFKGGRFDGTPDDPTPFLYAAEEDAAAVAEALLRDVPFDTQPRILGRARIRNKCLSWIRSTRDLHLVRLVDGEDLAQVGQDIWLVTCESNQYQATRVWAQAIRRWAPWCEGLVWRSRREPRSLDYIFFEDRMGPEGSPFEEVVDPGGQLALGDSRLDQGLGQVYLEGIVLRYAITLGP